MPTRAAAGPGSGPAAFLPGAQPSRWQRLTGVTTVPTMDWRTRARIIADAAVAAVQAFRKPRRCASCDELTWPTNPPTDRSPR